MHGSCLPLSSSKLTKTFLPLLLQNPCSSQHHTSTTRSSSSSITLICGFGGHEFTPITKASKRGRPVFTVRATSRESPYQVLGVSPSATPQQIKAAYRKLALKLHPDVNKEANAQEKFMRVKHAYNTLLNSEARRSDYSYSTTEGSRNRKSQDEEEFYGLGNFMRDVQITIEDFFRDIQTEFKNWEASADSQGKPKSLWEELADIGEEFVEFLEKELNITDSDTETENKDSSKGNQYEKFRSEQSGSNAVEESSIEDNIDDIEATLAQLKRELGL